MPRPIHRSRSSASAPSALSRRAILAASAAAASAAAVALAGSAAAGTAPGDSAGADRASGSASAGDAVAAYIGALAAADFDGAVATFAVDPYVENYDFAAWLNRVGRYQPTFAPQLLPNSDPFNTAINLAQRRSTVAREVTSQYFALVNPTLDRAHNGVLLEDEAAVDAFVDDLETVMVSAPLADLAIYDVVPAGDIDPDLGDLLADDRIVELNESQLAITGADESAELAVRSSISGRPVAMVFRAVRYADSWWIETLQGTLATLLGLDAIAPGVIWLDGGVAGSDGPADAAPASTSE